MGGGRVEARPPDVAVLDIGAGTGALVIHTTAALLGAEIEVSPLGRDGERVHVGVWDRRAAGATFFTAVFPPMLAGTYNVWLPDGSGRRRVTIADGGVTEIRL